MATQPITNPQSSDMRNQLAVVSSARCESALQEVETSLDRWLTARKGCPALLLEAMRYAVLSPGKRLRPRLALMGADAVGGNPSLAVPAACAVELIHAYSLVHDDLPAMDDDDLRRGRPTVHKQFDEATAILVGDALQALAFEILATDIQSPEAAVQSCAELAKTAGPTALIGGQADDLTGTNFDPVATKEEQLDQLRAIHRRKTGAMITTSLRVGAIAAQANVEQLSCLTTFGKAIGLAFQVTDDLLDASGNEQAVGKRLGKDAGHGKLTYPGLMGIEQSRAYASQLVAEANNALEPFGEQAQPLRELADKILHRDR